MVGRYVIAVMFSGTLGGLIQAAKKLEISLASQFANDIGNREFVSRGKPYIASAWMNHNTAIASENTVAGPAVPVRGASYRQQHR